jgi:hypothetical protein
VAGLAGAFRIDDAIDLMKLASACLALAAILHAAPACAAAAAPAFPDRSPEAPMTSFHAAGPFEVQLSPQPATPAAEAAGLSRMTLVKQFHGDLEAGSTGEMLAFRDADKTSGGYVALETVRGTLGGRHGSFVLQHSSTMTRGEPAQSVTVVPGSGTGELAGLAGRMVIDIAANGAHAYGFDYTLAEPPGK